MEFSNAFARSVVIFGVDNSSSYHTNNWKLNFLILGQRPTDGVNEITGAAGESFD